MSKAGGTVKDSARVARGLFFAIAIALGIVASVSQASAAESVQFEVTIAKASRSGSGIDNRLSFAQAQLTRYGFKSATYIRGYPFSLSGDAAKRFSVAERISGVIQLKGVVGPGGDRVQYHLTLYSGEKKQVDAVYSISRRGGTGIAVLDQPGGWAYIVIVRALR